MLLDIFVKLHFKNLLNKYLENEELVTLIPTTKVRGEIMKLIGNSSYGTCITNFLKHETVKIVTEDNYNKNIRRNNNVGHQDLNQGFEFRFKKTSFKQSLPIHIGFQEYQLAKLRMLEF